MLINGEQRSKMIVTAEQELRTGFGGINICGLFFPYYRTT
jgi:hypothetical protein